MCSGPARSSRAARWRHGGAGIAAKHPQRTQGLCLIDTRRWYGAEAPRPWRERAATGATRGWPRWSRSSDALVRRCVPGRASGGGGSADADLSPPTTFSAMSHLRNAGDADLRPLLRRRSRRLPAVVVGEEDYATPVAMAEALHQALPPNPRSPLLPVAVYHAGGKTGTWRSASAASQPRAGNEHVHKPRCLGHACPSRPASRSVDRINAEGAKHGIRVVAIRRWRHQARSRRPVDRHAALRR